jgi:MoaA/NifB/PqqE/SkfB family radical SAM enzyme
MLKQSLYHTWQRYKTLRSHVITALPIVILMPHSACNCRCVMCDIWKDNKNLKQLNEEDVIALVSSLKNLGTKQVLMSGGEAMLNPKFFELCRILKSEKFKITLLSTGLTLKRNAEKLLQWVDDIIVSIDGTEKVHDRIRNIDGAFSKLSEGVQHLKKINPDYRITARTVIHKLNFEIWPQIIDVAKEMNLDGISFLPADVSSHAFNREMLWNSERQNDVLIGKNELPLLEEVLDYIIAEYQTDFENHFIAESQQKLKMIAAYYNAVHGLCDFPFKRCNAPWVSAVLEADGNVRPCFFHPGYGNIHQQSLKEIINNERAINFRKGLNMDADETCKRCVCYLNLPPGTNPANI